MRITVIDKKVWDTLNKMERSVSELDRTLLKLSIMVAVSIKRRVVEGGRDLSGRQMAYKSTSYKIYRGLLKGRQTGYKDLLFSGRMWRSLSQEIFQRGKTNKAKIFFGSSDEADKALGNNDRQAFFGISSEEDKVINNAVQLILKGLY